MPNRRVDHRPALSPCEASGRGVTPCLEARTAMSKSIWFVIGVALLATFVSPATSEAKKKKERSSRKKKYEEELKKKEFQKTAKIREEFSKWRNAGMAMNIPENVESLTDDMGQLDEKVTLTEQQKKKIAETRAIRDKTLERWNKANRKKFDTIKAKLEKLKPVKGNKTCKAIVGRLNVMRKAHAGIASGYERKLFAVLTPDQRSKWNAPILRELIEQEFSAMELTEAQTAKITTACKARAKRCTLPVAAGNSKQITESMKKYVYTSVLTTKQRKAYAAAKKRLKGGEVTGELGG